MGMKVLIPPLETVTLMGGGTTGWVAPPDVVDVVSVGAVALARAQGGCLGDVKDIFLKGVSSPIEVRSPAVVL